MKIEKDFTRKEDSMKKVTNIGIARDLSHVVYSAKRANQTKSAFILEKTGVNHARQL